MANGNWFWIEWNCVEWRMENDFEKGRIVLSEGWKLILIRMKLGWEGE